MLVKMKLFKAILVLLMFVSSLYSSEIKDKEKIGVKGFYLGDSLQSACVLVKELYANKKVYGSLSSQERYIEDNRSCAIQRALPNLYLNQLRIAADKNHLVTLIYIQRQSLMELYDVNEQEFDVAGYGYYLTHNLPWTGKATTEDYFYTWGTKEWKMSLSMGGTLRIEKQ